MRCFRQALTGAVFFFVAGCSSIPRDVGLGERCGDMMRLAYPNAAIDVTKTDASATSLTTIIAHAEGVRANLPPDAPSPRDLAVECRFDEDILTDFHWTTGPGR